ncbi:hypothetical protein JW960_19155 [candidate division KSB1 bacterium]|nr:hypothetical protein [candidate division KSB1 bacterium]
MIEIGLNLKKDTEKKLKKIIAQYSDNEVFANQIINYETSELKKAIINLQIDLKKFERKYDLSSKEFYQKFDSGELGDNEDFIIWAGLFEMLNQNLNRLAELE